MPLNSLETRTLWLTVWHSDMFGRNDFLGEVTINLQGIVFDNPQPQWYTLQERVSYILFNLNRIVPNCIRHTRQPLPVYIHAHTYIYEQFYVYVLCCVYF